MKVTRKVYEDYKLLVHKRCLMAMGPAYRLDEDAAQECWYWLCRAQEPDAGVFPGFVRAVVGNVCKLHARTIRRQEMKGQKAGERVRFDDLDGGVAGGDMGDGTERRTLADTISDEWAAAENMDRELDAETVQKLAKEVLRPTVYAACYHPELVASKNTRSHYRAEGVRLIREALAA